MSSSSDIVVLICADAEWRAVRGAFPGVAANRSPFGEWFVTSLTVEGMDRLVTFVHGGWGKITAAASTQFAVDRWKPSLLVNLGTCGGFKGRIEQGTVVLVERAIVYDIVERMGDPAEAIAHYTTEIDLAWLGDGDPEGVRRGHIVSADRDLAVEEIADLVDRYGAFVADWESGAVAWVAARNGVRLLILRGVTDLVGPDGGEAYDGAAHVFAENTESVMRGLLADLPLWLARA